jgi:hypothetical protein
VQLFLVLKQLPDFCHHIVKTASDVNRLDTAVRSGTDIEIALRHLFGNRCQIVERSRETASERANEERRDRSQDEKNQPENQTEPIAHLTDFSEFDGGHHNPVDSGNCGDRVLSLLVGEHAQHRHFSSFVNEAGDFSIELLRILTDIGFNLRQQHCRTFGNRLTPDNLPFLHHSRISQRADNEALPLEIEQL